MLIFQLESQGPEMSEFFESLRGQRINNGDPFAEPVLLKGNIENGLGFFGLYSLSDSVKYRYYY